MQEANSKIRRGILTRKIPIGEKFNRLTFLEPVKDGIFWRMRCRCECGKEGIFNAQNVREGMTKSCGCLQSESRIKHGRAGTKEYLAWMHMKDRCFNANRKKFKNHGGRGITVCAEWMKFENFFRDMGISPAGSSLERKDNNGNYEPGNCQWADAFVQNNNTRRNKLVVYNGESYTAAEFARRFGEMERTVLWRLYNGWSVEDAAETPFGVRRKKH